MGDESNSRKLEKRARIRMKVVMCVGIVVATMTFVGNILGMIPLSLSISILAIVGGVVIFRVLKSEG